MFTNFTFMGENEAIIEKRVNTYELSLFLKSYPEDGFSSILERVWTKYGLVEDYFNEEEETWYPGFSMPPTWWLVAQIRTEYGPDPIFIKVPASLLELVEAVRQPPKRRWRTIGKEKRKLCPWLR